MYDVVWYAPDRVADAERVLERLPLDEVVTRGCPDLCLSQPGIPIPGQDGLGTCACANFLGASDCLQLGASSRVAALCELTDHGTGLVGGTLKASFWLSPDLRAAEEIAEDRERLLLAQKPPTAGYLFACARVALSTFILTSIACLCAIPRSFRKEPKRTIRPLSVLEREAGIMLGALKRGI
jgi:hypothetical protein